MSRFLIASTPVPAHSTNPLPFAARLVEDGHEVVWYAGNAFAERIVAVGARHAPMPASIDLSVSEGYDRFQHILRGSGITQIRRAFSEYFFGTVPMSVRELRKVLQEFPADVILSDCVMMAPQFVHELGGPIWATYGDGPIVLDEPGIPPFGPGLRYRSGRFGQLRNAAVRRIARRTFAPVDTVRDNVRSRLGLQLDGRHAMDIDISPFLHLQGCTPGFEYPIRNLPPQLHWVGALRPDPGPWTRPSRWQDLIAAEVPVVHVSQGSIRPDMTELIVPAVRALADQPVLVIVTTGGPTADDLEQALGCPVPGNVIVSEFVPYDELLPLADVFVTNGGYTGVTLALAHGVPIVQAGTTEEKAENAARIEYSGAGIALGASRPSTRKVARAVEKVLATDRFRLAAERIAAEMAEHDAGREGADLLAELAATRRRVHSHTAAVSRHAAPRSADTIALHPH